MTNLKGKVIVVTGASSGIGQAIAEALVKEGCRVVGCGRNIGRLQDIANSLTSKEGGKFYPIKCDVSIEDNILGLFKYVEEEFASLYAVVSNAGIVEYETLLNGTSTKWMKMLQVNVLAVAICAREAVKLMKKFEIDNGHIVNINSISGRLISKRPFLHFYCATKHAVTAMSEGIRQELRAEKSHIRVTSICPGLVKTEIFDRAAPENPNVAASIWAECEVMETEDVAKSVLYSMKTPQRVDVSEIFFRSTEQI